MAEGDNSLDFGGRLALVGIVSGFAGTLAAMALPLAYPDTPAWVWRAIFWPSIIVMAVALIFLIVDLVTRGRIGASWQLLKSNVQAIGALFFVAIALSAWLWYAAMATPHVEDIPLPRPRPAEASSATLATDRMKAVLSRGDKTFFTCKSPAPDEQAAKSLQAKIDAFKKSLDIVGDAVGVTFTVTMIRGGYRLEVAPTTDEMKSRLAMTTGIPNIGKITYEVRRVSPENLMVTIYIDFPEPLKTLYSMMVPDPTSNNALEAAKQVDIFLHIAEGSCREI